MSSKSTDKEATKRAAKAVEQEKTDTEVAGESKPEATTKKPAEQKDEKRPAEKAAKKTTAKKTTAKKVDKPELKPELYIEYQGNQILDTVVVDRVKAAFVASGHRVSSIKSLQIYMKPEESKAYYVINNGKYTGNVDLY